ncbi:hypothetical protein HDV62DRAFT_52287 [Trichoderma sp. SZMC 28011]
MASSSLQIQSHCGLFSRPKPRRTFPKQESHFLQRLSLSLYFRPAYVTHHAGMNIFSLSFSALCALISHLCLTYFSVAHLTSPNYPLSPEHAKVRGRKSPERGRFTYYQQKITNKKITKREVSSIQESNCPPTLRSNNTHTPALPYLTVPTRTSLPFSAHCTPPVESIRTIQITQKAFSSNTSKPRPPLKFPRRKGGTKMNATLPFYTSLLVATLPALYEICTLIPKRTTAAPRFHIHCTARKKKELHTKRTASSRSRPPVSVTSASYPLALDIPVRNILSIVCV